MDGYNEQIAYGGCFPLPLNGRYLVGCVAVAVGQVMCHNEYPSSFDWEDIFNDGDPGGTETNAFLRDLGLPGNLNMVYGCGSSLAYDTAAVRYLKTEGYSYTSTTTNISTITILDNLRYGYPVIISGQGATGRHMWVCDGIKSYYDMVCFAAGGSYDYSVEYNANEQYLHMNWGWDGDFNGWFSLYNFNPNGNTFNNYKLLIYNIKH